MNINKFAEIIGEGFLADKIVENKDCELASNYIDTIIKGREIKRGNHLSHKSIFYLGRYIRFLKWLKETHGKVEYISNYMAEKIINQKLHDLKKCLGDWLKFFVWLQKETLSEASSYFEEMI